MWPPREGDRASPDATTRETLESGPYFPPAQPREHGDAHTGGETFETEGICKHRIPGLGESHLAGHQHHVGLFWWGGNRISQADPQIPIEMHRIYAPWLKTDYKAAVREMESAEESSSGLAHT